jgi:secreted trypsin-like serine protease
MHGAGGACDHETPAGSAPVQLIRGLGVLACALMLQGCGDDSDPTAQCTAALQMPIYFGQMDPQQIELGTEQRAAIGLVAPVGQVGFCTGVLMPNNWVLTARHCDTGVPLAFQTSGDPSKSAAVVSVTHHPEYDVMLVGLDGAADSLPAEPISLWSSPIDESWVGLQVTLAGVGETETGELGFLRFVDEQVVLVNEVEIRVDGMGKSGACLGDSGGPLLVGAPDGSARVAGVLDRGSQNCLGLDVYTRADRILEWVIQVTSVRAPRAPCHPAIQPDGRATAGSARG